MYKFVFFVPEAYLESVKKAVFAAGAGKVGSYDFCSWQIKGTGQFMPKAGANPFLGKLNEVEIVEEYRVEMLCEENLMHHVIRAFKHAHPYETPAYEVLKLEDY